MIRNLDLLRLQVFKSIIIFVWIFPHRREYLDINCNSFIYTALPDIHVIAWDMRVSIIVRQNLYLFFFHSKRIEPWQNRSESPLDQKCEKSSAEISKRSSVTNFSSIYYLSVIVRLISHSLSFLLSLSFSREPWVDTIVTINYRKSAPCHVSLSRLLFISSFSQNKLVKSKRLLLQKYRVHVRAHYETLAIEARLQISRCIY